MSSSPEYPVDSVQAAMGSQWWVPAKSAQIQRGRLLWAFVPYVGLTPWTLQATRASATSHQSAHFELVPLRVHEAHKAPSIPVAALHTHPGEVNAVYKAKRRPVLVVSTGGNVLADELLKKAKGWKTAAALVVAPYFGVDPGGTRGGWDPEFVRRIRTAEYPQYVYDRLPIGGSTGESILRLDHLQPIGRHHDSYELTDWVLSADALAVLDDWVAWLLTGTLVANSVLAWMREQLPSQTPQPP